MTCPHCRQDHAARDHTDCAAWEADDRALVATLKAHRAPARCADAAAYVLASAPPGIRLRVAEAVVKAWVEP